MNVFEEFALEYDEWFETHKWVYQSEVAAVRKFMQKTGEGVEIGVGTGRFSIQFGIKVGVEPAKAMAEIVRLGSIILKLFKPFLKTLMKFNASNQLKKVSGRDYLS